MLDTKKCANEDDQTRKNEFAKVSPECIDMEVTTKKGTHGDADHPSLSR